MLQKEDLKAVVAEVVEEIIGSRKQEEPVSIEEEYYTREQACKHLHISTTKLWRMERAGTISAYKIGRRSLYSKNAIDGLIKSSTVGYDLQNLSKSHTDTCAKQFIKDNHYR